MSAITDRARDFWDRISPRERNLVVLAAIATPLVLAFWLGSAIHDGLGAMEHRNDRTRKALVAVETMRAKGETKPIVDDSVAAMTTEPLPLPTYITNAAKKAKFELKSTITPHGAQPKGGFVTNSASLQVDKLDIEQVKDFLNALEADSKVVAITTLELDRDFRDKDKLRLDLEVSTYSREAPKAGSDAGSAGLGKAR
jgi:type II secretory pathway component PulM